VETERTVSSESFGTQLKRIRRTFIFLSTVKVQVVITGSAIIAFSVTEMFCLKLLKPVIDTVQQIKPGETAKYSGFFDWLLASEGSGAALRHAILILIVAKIFLGLTMWAKTVATSWQSMSMVFYMRAAVYDKLQRVGFAFHDEYATGQLINRSISDLQNVRTFIMTGLNNIIEIIFVLIAYFFMLWFDVSPKVALAAMAPLPIWFWAIRRFAILAQPIYEAQTKCQDKMVEVLTENIAGVHVIRAFATEDQERQKFNVAAGKVRGKLMEAVTLRVKMIPLIRGIAIASSVGLFVLGAWLAERGSVSIGALAILGGAMGNLLSRIQLINQIADAYQQAVVSSKRLFDMLDNPSNTPERTDAEPLLPGAGGVRFNHVSFSYDPGFPVVEDIGFTIKPGSIVAVVGPTGSGKTTLAALLGRFYDPDLGRIEIDGQDIRDVTLRSVREAVGYVFQETYLFSDTIARNIAYGDLTASREKIREAARLARADEFIEQLPGKYDQVIGEYGASLSGGQKQRLAIARAILHNPRILVLDDALASVDPETETLIRQGLERIMRGRTVFMITSRISSARRAHHILVVQRGKITQSGTHDELMRVEGYYRDVASSQFAEDTTLDEHSHMDRMTRLSKRSGRVVHE
jgi:ATP-binding cassette subfamily B multidrug efflux pump